jgi:hypothetical protein
VRLGNAKSSKDVALTAMGELLNAQNRPIGDFPVAGSQPEIAAVLDEKLER